MALKHFQGSAILVQGTNASLVTSYTYPNVCQYPYFPPTMPMSPISVKSCLSAPFMPFPQTHSMFSLWAHYPHSPVSTQCLWYSPNTFPGPPSTSKYPLWCLQLLSSIPLCLLSIFEYLLRPPSYYLVRISCHTSSLGLLPLKIP